MVWIALESGQWALMLNQKKAIGIEIINQPHWGIALLYLPEMHLRPFKKLLLPKMLRQMAESQSSFYLMCYHCAGDQEADQEIQEMIHT